LAVAAPAAGSARERRCARTPLPARPGHPRTTRSNRAAGRSRTGPGRPPGGFRRRGEHTVAGEELLPAAVGQLHARAVVAVHVSRPPRPAATPGAPRRFRVPCCPSDAAGSRDLQPELRCAAAPRGRLGEAERLLVGSWWSQMVAVGMAVPVNVVAVWSQSGARTAVSDSVTGR
jgi:hypothetical protein